jgi:hypothetical protein
MLAAMLTFRTRTRWWLLGTIAAALVTALAALLLKPVLEQEVRSRIESAAIRQGVVARIGQVHVGISPLVQLQGFDLDPGHGIRLHADLIAVTWHGRPRLAVRAAMIEAPAGIMIRAPSTVWDVESKLAEDLRFALVEPQAGLSIHKQVSPAGSSWTIEAQALDVGHLLDVRREDRPLLDGGIAEGRLDIQTVNDALHFHIDMSAHGARLPALADNAADEPQLGDPTDLAIRFDGAWHRKAGMIEIPEVHATVASAALSGAITLRDIDTDPAIDLTFGVQHLDFAQLLGASGLPIPDSLGFAPDAGHDLGAAAIDLRVRGRLADPASLVVSQKIDFKPPRQMPPAIARLRGGFVFKSEDGPGPHRAVDVSPTSPDFIALSDVPRLFVRSLLLAEDAGFYSHRGIDLRELPVALLTNWSRGGAARGASTITQQLAKNLFLSRDKQLGRKLQELAITFLLESALGKNRILEIYLNIIEWGPDLRGLRPAARRYFDCEPRELTPAQMAFLVEIIPGPIKYQSSFAHGMPGPGLRLLIDELLAKLRSVSAISEEEYRRALSEAIVVGGGKKPPE